MNHSNLATRLPAIEPSHARLQSGLLAALDGAMAGDFVLRAAADDGPALPALRFHTPGGTIELAPCLVDGAVPVLLADDGLPDAVPALAALAALEPLVAAIERVLGVGLSPAGVGVAALPVRLRIEAVVDEAVVHCVVLGVAADAGFAPQPLPVDPARLAALPAAIAFVADGPVLAATRIAALAAGDLVLIGSRILGGRLAADGRNWPARFDPAAAALTLSETGSNPLTDPSAGPSLDPDLALALTVRIDGGSRPLGELSRLAPGTVVQLGLPGGALSCMLEVSGQPVAAGELVAVGDAYGVLITRRIGEAG